MLRPARPAAGSPDAAGTDSISAGQDPAGTDRADVADADDDGADMDLADSTGSADTSLADADADLADADSAEPGVLPVLPDPVPRDGERALARFGLLGEGAVPVFTPGARYPLAGLLLALPPLAQSGLLACTRQVYGRLRNGFYGMEVMLVMGVFMALLREAEPV